MNYALIQLKVDRGLSHAGKHLGEPFSCYRVEDTCNGDWPGGWTLLDTKYPIYRERVPEPKLETALSKGALWYNIYGSMIPFNLGDVFLCTDPPYSPGLSYGAEATILPNTPEINAFALAWHMPARIPTGARLSHQVRIYRSSVKPKQLTDGSYYWDSTLENDQPLILQAGQFTFGTPGSTEASIVPAGFMGAYRPSGSLPFGPPPPGMIRPTHWYVYVPPLPGYEPLEGDALVTVTDDRYVVVEPYHQEAGVVGSQLLVDRQIGHR
jgi:hypothetical protein